ncbi:aminopeptidase N-like [Condylostylus longicornis]|uniref:aminopeptidase N-like n=1 Tax=Condylostylus longicornis TaxID=2530218 RepID=UPI00244E0441|nr:aminopeptidase N-like [Condylostylus longicornis]
MFSLIKHLLVCLEILIICQIISISNGQEIIKITKNENAIDNNITLSDNNENVNYDVNIKHNITNQNQTTAADKNFIDQITFRLPNNTIPLLYDLYFNFSSNYTNNEETNFTGHTNIKVLVIESTRYIVLSAKGLMNFKVHVTHLSLLQNNKKTGLYFVATDESVISTIDTDILTTGKGRIVTNLQFEPSYGKPVVLTYFEPTYAKTAFPCFDEPFFKAKFVVQLTYSSDYRAISNTPIEFDYVIENSDQDTSPTRTTKFMESPLMSSYQLAFVLHPNHSHVSIERNNITYSLYYTDYEAKTKNVEILRHTVKEVARIMSSLEELFEIPFPLPKMDMIGVPKTTGLAIENWGLLIFNQEKAFLDITCKTIEDHYRTVIFTHELVHQWFGNLVTTQWWSTTWLNEGFASHYGIFLAMKLFPECGISQDYAHLDMRLLKFHVTNKHPISNYVETDDEILANFSPTSYNQDFFKTWAHNFDVPEVTVIRNYKTNEIILKQSSMTKNSSDLWYIPLNFATATQFNFSDTHFTYIMNATDDSVKVDAEVDLNLNLKESDWLFVNKKGIGSYSVKYDKANWLLLAKTLQQNYEVFDSSSRIFILIDVLTYLRKADFDENFDMEVVLEILSYLEFEKDIAVWYHVQYWLINGNTYCTDDIEFANEIVKIIINRLSSNEEEDFMYIILQNFLGPDASPSWNLVIDNIESNFEKMMQNEDAFEEILETIVAMPYTPEYEKKIDKIIQRYQKEKTSESEVILDRSTTQISKYRKYEKQVSVWLTNYFHNNENRL